MAIETIQTNVGVEQEVVVPYGKENLRFVFQFNDYFNNWFFNLLNDGTGEVILMGAALTLGFDAFFGLGLNYGTLTLTDTEPTNPNPIALKIDFGNRLKLVRNYNA